MKREVRESLSFKLILAFNIYNVLLPYFSGIYIVTKAICGTMQLVWECKNMVCCRLYFLRRNFMGLSMHLLHQLCNVRLSDHHLYYGSISKFWKYIYLLALFNLRLFQHVAGTDQVVLGDLVYCKGDNTENVSGGMLECEDDSKNDADDSNHLDEISGTDLPEERNNLVKVWCHSPWIIYYLYLYIIIIAAKTQPIWYGVPWAPFPLFQVGVIFFLLSSYMSLLYLNNPELFLDARDINVHSYTKYALFVLHGPAFLLKPNLSGRVCQEHHFLSFRLV